MPGFITAAEAAGLIEDGMNVGISGFGGWLGADLVFAAMRERFRTEGSPKGISVFSGILPGSLSADDCGMNILATEGLIRSVTAAHLGMAPLFSRLVYNEGLEAFAIPLGVVGGLLRAAAGRKPGILTRVGLGTFCDPRLEGCAMNRSAAAAGRSPAELVKVDDIKAALASGKVHKYVADFPTAEVNNCKGIVAVPHLGASTEEAEDNCAVMAANELKDYIENGNIVNSVNLPCLKVDSVKAHRATVIAKEGAALPEGATAKTAKGYVYAVYESDDAIDADALGKIDGVIRVRVIR